MTPPDTGKFLLLLIIRNIIAKSLSDYMYLLMPRGIFGKYLNTYIGRSPMQNHIDSRTLCSSTTQPSMDADVASFWSKKRVGDFKNKKGDPILDGNMSTDYRTLVHITT